MTFSQAIATCMGKYAVFTGRASRSEYWWFFLFTLLMFLGVGMIDVVLDGSNQAAGLVAALVFLLPSLSVGARRLHDTGKSGWWLLLYIIPLGSIVLLILFALPTSPAGDKYTPEGALP